MMPGKMWNRPQKESVKLTSKDYYYANEPKYLAKMDPEKRKALIAEERAHQPARCGECLFFRWVPEIDKMVTRCAIWKGKPPPVGRPKQCPIRIREE